MGIDKRIKYWIDLALDDLDSAEIMLKKKKYLQCGFYCHQTIEKSLKAYYWYNCKIEPPFTHNLLKLANECKFKNDMSSDMKNHIDLLMPLNIEARYPDEKKDLMRTLDKKRTESIYFKTEELMFWIHKQVKK